MRARSGVALFAALSLMVVIGLLVAGALAAVTMSQRSWRMARSDALLTSAANFGLGTVLADPAAYGLADIPLGRTRSFAIPVSDSPIEEVGVNATRLPDGVLWLVARAASPAAEQGRRRFNIVARFPSPGAVPPAGIVARGDVRLGAGVVMTRDTVADKECDGRSAADIVLAPGASVVRAPGFSDSITTLSLPKAADSATYFQTARQMSLLDSGSRIVRVRADTTIDSGTFDGILIVDGSLTIAGTFRATGLIVVRGRVSAIAGGFSLNGALVSFAAGGGSAGVDLAAATIVYAPCAVSRAFRWALPPRPVRKRSWAEMF